MKNEKVLYIVNTTIDSHRGVSKKISFQCKALKKVIETELCCYFYEEQIFGRKILGEKEENIYSIKQNNYFRKILNKIKKNYDYDKIYEYVKKNNIKIIYMRYLAEGNYKLIKFFSKLKKDNIKIVLEIPTYPYDLEYKKGKIVNKLKLFQDQFYRKKLKKYVDKIVTFSEDKEIWSIPCINIQNGIDIEEVKLIKKKEHSSINFISVSTVFFWHGIDRFIYSLLRYKQDGGEEEIKFHIVGEGTETPKLKKIVEDNIELQDIVILHGFKSGKELDEIYNNSDIALGSLGNHRKGLLDGGGLKNREYCAKGIPFIKAGYDRFENCQFIYDVPNDESLLDIEKIIEWYKNLKVTPEEIRKYAEDNLTWDKQMKKVIDSI